MTPGDQLRNLGAIPANAEFQAFVCAICGSEFPSSPRTVRFLAGSRGDPDSPGLCWVCNRLRQSVNAFAFGLRKVYAYMDEPAHD